MQNQTIPVVYLNERYNVDYSSLHNSSIKFRQMVQPFINSGTDIQKLQLRILYNKFNARSVSNFLKICQNQDNDVMDNDVKEICELAKMFQAEQIYNTGLDFVHKSIDPYFYIPNSFIESNEERYLVIESGNDTLIHHVNLNELEFEDDCVLPQSRLDPKSKSSSVPNIHYFPPESSSKDESHSLIYQIQIDNPLMKCRRFYCLRKGRVLYMAKQKNNDIFIGEGSDFHIHEKKFDNSAKISQNSEGYNIVNTDDQEFKIVYVPFGSKKQYSLKTSFVNRGKRVAWIPSFSNNFNGESNHVPIQSKKNILLKNKAGHPTFIVRRMSKICFEVECHSSLNPLIVFSLGISQIVGPASF